MDDASRFLLVSKSMSVVKTSIMKLFWDSHEPCTRRSPQSSSPVSREVSFDEGGGSFSCDSMIHRGFYGLIWGETLLQGAALVQILAQYGVLLSTHLSCSSGGALC